MTRKMRPRSPIMSPPEIIAGVLLAALIVFSLLRMAVLEWRLRDPNDHSVVYLHQVEEIASLSGDGPFLVRTYRQSGNLHQDDRVTDNSEIAIRAAVTTLRRAKIDYVVVSKNTPSALKLTRPFHCHRGRAEGKKVGWIEIHAADSTQSGGPSFISRMALPIVLTVTVAAIVVLALFSDRIIHSLSNHQPPEPVPPKTAESALAEERTWTDNQGRTLRASLLSLQKDEQGLYVGRFRRPSGDVFPYHIGNLSLGDIELVKRLSQNLKPTEATSKQK